MKLKYNGKTIQKFLIFLVIMALFSFGDYSNAVYVIKILAIVGLVYTERVIRAKYHFQWACLFILLCAFSIIWSSNFSYATFYVAWTLQAMGLAVAIGNTIHDESDIEYVLKCIFIAGIVLAARVFMNTSFRALGTFRLGMNMGYNSNELSLKASVACVTGFYFLYRQKTRLNRFLIVAALVVLAATVMFTGSRKGSIMMIMGAVLYNIIRSKSPARFTRNVFISGMLLFGFFYLIINSPLLYNVLGRRLLLTFNLFNSDAYVGNSIANRRNLISIGIELFGQSPFIGYGIGNFREVSGTGLYAHNNYIELLVDLGITGTVLYYSMYVYNTYYIIRKIRTDRALLGLLLTFSLMLIVLEYGLVTFQGDYVQIIIALCAYSISITKSREAKGNMIKNEVNAL